MIDDAPLYRQFQGSYEDPLLGKRRQAARFQEQHWSWKGLTEYLFNSPSVLTFAKQDDLNYLQHVLKTARTMKTENSVVYFGNLLAIANRSLVLKRLQKTPEVRARFIAYEKEDSVQKIWSRFYIKVFTWTSEPVNRSERNTRAALAERTTSALRTSNMSFDTYILDQYFDLVRAFKIESPKSVGKLASTETLSNWRSFDTGLAQGSLSHATDFLFQNSHDVEMKAHLSRILSEMEKVIAEQPDLADGSASKSSERFQVVYKEAKKRVESQMTLHQAPEMYRTDMHIYTVHHRAENSGNSDKQQGLDRITVRWNSVLGKLQADVVSANLLKDRLKTISDIPQFRKYVRRYFENFRRSGTYSQSETTHDETAELEASLADTTFITFTKQGTSEIVGMIRIFDGNNGQPIYIEKEFPHLRLPERESKTPIF